MRMTGETRISHCASQRQRHGRLTFTGHRGGDDERTRGYQHSRSVGGAQLTDGFRAHGRQVLPLTMFSVQVVTNRQNAQDACTGCLVASSRVRMRWIQCTAQEDCRA